jgi:type VI secretion system protein ImpI
MNLSLEIVSPNGQSLGPARRKVFGPEGGRIGRSPDCDWVLSNPYISRHHATVRWISGTYYIESTGENGVAINTPQAMIPQRERRALKSGDRLFVDEYEMTVNIGAAVGEPLPAAVVGFTPSNDPLLDLAATARSPVLENPLEPSHDELDPLKQLAGGARGQAPTPRPEANWNHTPGVLDQFTPPPVPPAPRAGIPDDWDKTSYARAGTPTPAPAGTRPAPPTPGAFKPDSPAPDPLAPANSAGASREGFAPIPDDWDKTSFGRPIASGSQPVSPAPLDALSPRPIGSPAAAGAQPLTPGLQPGPRPRSAPLPLRPGVTGSAPQPAAAPQTLQPAPAAPASAQQVPARRSVDSAAGNLDLTAFLRAAGLDPASVPPETAASLGRILRTVVQGAVEVLQARAEIKNQFRLPLTRIQTAENNPLKFAVNAEDALNSLLGRRNPAYLGPVEAFEDAFDDIRFHQVAMLAGMRAGFEHAMKRFDPQRLQEVFDKRVKRGGLLQMSAKSRYWELYAQEFRELTADPEDAFKRLFGEVFAGAYEQQLEELKRSRRKPPR